MISKSMVNHSMKAASCALQLGPDSRHLVCALVGTAAFVGAVLPNMEKALVGEVVEASLGWAPWLPKALAKAAAENCGACCGAPPGELWGCGCCCICGVVCDVPAAAGCICGIVCDVPAAAVGLVGHVVDGQVVDHGNLAAGPVGTLQPGFLKEASAEGVHLAHGSPPFIQGTEGRQGT